MASPWSLLPRQEDQAIDPAFLQYLNPEPSVAQATTLAAPGTAPAMPSIQPVAIARPAPLPSQEKGSGKTLRDQYEENLRNSFKKQEVNLMTPQQLQEAMAGAASLPAFQAQEQGLADQENRLRMEEMTPTPMDFSALSPFVSYLTKGQFKGVPRVTEDPQARYKRITDAYGKIQDDRRDLTKTISDLIGKQKAGYTLQDVLSTAKLSQMDQSQDPALHAARGGDESLKFKRFQDGFQNGKLVAPLIKTVLGGIADDGTQIVGAKGLLPKMANDANWASDVGLRGQLLTVAHMSPVSDRDMVQVSGDPGAWEKLQTIIQKLQGGQGTFRPEDRKLLQDFLRVTIKKSADLIQQHANLYAESAAPYYGWDTATARKNLESVIPQVNVAKPESMLPKKTPAKAPVTRTKKLEDMTDEELKAYEKSLGGK